MQKLSYEYVFTLLLCIAGLNSRAGKAERSGKGVADDLRKHG